MNRKHICLSVSRRNEDKVDLLDEYADMLGMSRSNANFYIIGDYNRLKTKERIRELEGASWMEYLIQ